MVFFSLLFSITDFVLVVAIIVSLLSFTNGAPTDRRHNRRHVSFSDRFQTPPPWVNPCGVDLFNVSRVVSVSIFHNYQHILTVHFNLFHTKFGIYILLFPKYPG